MGLCLDPRSEHPYKYSSSTWGQPRCPAQRRQGTHRKENNARCGNSLEPLEEPKGGTGPSHVIDRITPVRRREIRRACCWASPVPRTHLRKARIMRYYQSRPCSTTPIHFPASRSVMRPSRPSFHSPHSSYFVSPLSFVIARKATGPLVRSSLLDHVSALASLRGAREGWSEGLAAQSILTPPHTPALGRPHSGKATRPYGGHTLSAFLQPLANLPVSDIQLPPRVAQRHPTKSKPPSRRARAQASHPRLQLALTIPSGYPCETATNASLLSWDGMRECSSATERSGWQHS